MQRWLWVTRPDVWAKIPGGTLAHGQPYEWTCHEHSEPKDVALLYRADAARDIAHVFRIEDWPWEDDSYTRAGETDWWCECTLRHTLKQPIQLWDMRKRPTLAGWRAMQVDFNGSAFEIDAEVWRDLLEMAHPLDRQKLRLLGGN